MISLCDEISAVGKTVSGILYGNGCWANSRYAASDDILIAFTDGTAIRLIATSDDGTACAELTTNGWGLFKFRLADLARLNLITPTLASNLTQIGSPHRKD